MAAVTMRLVGSWTTINLTNTLGKMQLQMHIWLQHLLLSSLTQHLLLTTNHQTLEAFGILWSTSHPSLISCNFCHQTLLQDLMCAFSLQFNKFKLQLQAELLQWFMRQPECLCTPSNILLLTFLPYHASTLLYSLLFANPFLRCCSLDVTSLIYFVITGKVQKETHLQECTNKTFFQPHEIITKKGAIDPVSQNDQIGALSCSLISWRQQSSSLLNQFSGRKKIIPPTFLYHQHVQLHPVPSTLLLWSTS